MSSQIQEKDTPSNSRMAGKAVSNSGSVWGTAPVCSLLGAFSGSHKGHQNGCLKQIRVPDISPANLVILGISRDLQFGVCIHGEPHGSPHTAREGEHFYREEKEVGRAIVNKEPTAFQSVFARKGEKSLFFLLGLAILQGMRASPSGLSTLFEVSVY